MMNSPDAVGLSLLHENTSLRGRLMVSCGRYKPTELGLFIQTECSREVA